MNVAELASLEEEVQKDLEAIARVRRMLEIRNGLAHGAKPPPQHVILIGDAKPPVDLKDVEGAPVTSLRGKIEHIINSDPALKWTTQRMLAHLQRIGFPLKAKKPIYSIG